MVRFLWLAWVAWVVAATAGIFKWHLDYFSSPGPQFHRIALVAVPALGVFAWVYAAVRKNFLWRYEPAALALLAALICAAYEPRATLVVALFFAASSAAGRFALESAGLTLESPVERICAGFGVGAGIFMVLLTIAGLAGLLYPSAMLVLVLLPPVIFWKQLRETISDFREIARDWRKSAGAARPLTGIAVVFGAVAMIASLMLALAPSIAFDAVAFHLPLVQYYSATHALRPVPGIDYSYYPQGIELLWTLAYLLAGQAGAQMMSLIFSAMFVLALAAIAKRCGLGVDAALVAIVLAVTMPFLHWTASVMKNDLALAFFEAMALYAFLRWLDRQDFRWIAASSFSLALSFDVKHVALFAALPLLLFYGYALVWSDLRLKRAAILVAFLLTGTFWMARAWWLTGNPVAPARAAGAVHRPPPFPGAPLFRPIVRIIDLPRKVLFWGQRSFESPLPNPAGIVLFALAPLVFFGGRIVSKNRAAQACAIFTAAYLIYWGSLIHTVRYAILPIALLAMLLAARALRYFDLQTRVVRFSIAGLMTYCLLIAAMGLAIVGVNAPQFRYFAHRLDQNGYLRAAMEAYGAVDFLRRHGAGHARIFGVENLARAYSADPSNFEAMWCPPSQPCDAASVLAAIRAYHADYVILPEDGKIPEAVLQGLPGAARVYQDRSFSVFALGR